MSAVNFKVDAIKVGMMLEAQVIVKAARNADPQQMAKNDPQAFMSVLFTMEALLQMVWSILDALPPEERNIAMVAYKEKIKEIHPDG